MKKQPSKNYYNDEFLVKLQIGKYWEEKAIQRIITYLNEKYQLINTNDNYKYDFELSNMLKYEVKFDARAVETSNIFIEYLQFNISSGIQTTEADYYIIIVPKTTCLYLLISVFDIKELIRNDEYKFIIQPTQKNNYTAGYIFDIHIILLRSISF